MNDSEDDTDAFPSPILPSNVDTYAAMVRRFTADIVMLEPYVKKGARFSDGEAVAMAMLTNAVSKLNTFIRSHRIEMPDSEQSYNVLVLCQIKRLLWRRMRRRYSADILKLITTVRADKRSEWEAAEE